MINNEIISELHKFNKPDKNFLKDKECLICLESINLELQQLVKLPCNCANCVYHIKCIVQLLNSGQNKNFCPHCKINYTLTQREEEPQLHVINNNGRIRMFVTILYVHILSNSIMNVINISESKDYPQEDANIVSKILVMCSFLKLIINAYIVVKVKGEVEKIEHYLSFSYAFQTLLFILFICLLSSIKRDYDSIVLLINNIFFYFGDLLFRIAMEFRVLNIIQIQN